MVSCRSDSKRFLAENYVLAEYLQEFLETIKKPANSRSLMESLKPKEIIADK